MGAARQQRVHLLRPVRRRRAESIAAVAGLDDGRRSEVDTVAELQIVLAGAELFAVPL
jgi:hypothetical protein